LIRSEGSGATITPWQPVNDPVIAVDAGLRKVFADSASITETPASTQG
jgi:hypothetical protein